MTSARTHPPIAWKKRIDKLQSKLCGFRTLEYRLSVSAWGELLNPNDNDLRGRKKDEINQFPLISQFVCKWSTPRWGRLQFWKSIFYWQDLSHFRINSFVLHTVCCFFFRRRIHNATKILLIQWKCGMFLYK